MADETFQEWVGFIEDATTLSEPPKAVLARFEEMEREIIADVALNGRERGVLRRRVGQYRDEVMAAVGGASA